MLFMLFRMLFLLISRSRFRWIRRWLIWGRMFSFFRTLFIFMMFYLFLLSIFIFVLFLSFSFSISIFLSLSISITIIISISIMFSRKMLLFSISISILCILSFSITNHKIIFTTFFPINIFSFSKFRYEFSFSSISQFPTISFLLSFTPCHKLLYRLWKIYFDFSIIYCSFLHL